MSEVRAGFARRYRWLIGLGGGALVVLAGLAVAAEVALHRVQPFLRARIVEGLHEHFHARVELDDFHVSLVHGLSAVGTGLRIWPPAQVGGVEAPATPGGGEPLIRLAEFRFRAPLHFRRGVPIHITQVLLTGLEIHVPPRTHFHPPGAPEANEKPATAPIEPARPNAGGAGDASGAASSQNASTDSAQSNSLTGPIKFIVDKIVCTGATLVLETDKPDKLPLEFAIARVTMANVTAGEAMNFDAELTNPKPVGTIYSTGSFGPWVVEDPGESPVNGKYTFKDADLGTFKGIAGILNSTGAYEGTLRNMTVDGDTDTPDFRLTHFGNTMPLHTHFHARVDGTNGDTWLEPVDATLGRSHFTAKGQVVRVGERIEGVLREQGRDVALHIDVDRARIEDFLHLASGTPTQLLTGDVRVRAALHVPPGTAPVIERMTLAGTFHLDQARFASPQIQDRIEELSLRGQGRLKELKTADSSTVRSEMDGTFSMGGGVVKLPTLVYKVPGADIDLTGAYGVTGGTLDFTGTAKLEATVSKIVGGWKGMLLKPADRFFKKDGAGTEVPIYVAGTREAPKFGLDFKRFKTTSPETPGQK